MSLKLKLDTESIKVRDIKQLEKSKGFTELTEWFVKFGGASMEDLDGLTIAELLALAKESIGGLTNAALPNGNGANSS